MEEKANLTKQLFKNYLRDLYIELTPDELALVKAKCDKIKDRSWCAVIPDIRLLKGILSYYLILNKCPEYKLMTTVDLIESRFSEETKDLVTFEGILILRHSIASIRNKLMLETLLYLVAERAYKNKDTIVISDVARDKGEYLYYDMDSVIKYIPNQLNEESSILSIGKPFKDEKANKSLVNTLIKSSPHTRPLANMKADRILKEQQLKDRSKSIEESAKNAI